MSSELVKNMEAPAWLSSDEPRGTEDLKSIVVPSRLKVMQPQTQDTELAEIFNLGDVVLIPEKELIHQVGGEAVSFVPVLFYREWCTWNPLKMQGTLPFIRNRSFDPNGDIARLSANEDTRTEACPENPKEDLRHMAHLNYLVMLRGVGGSQLPVLMTFVSAEFKIGRRFANLVIARNAPLYTGVYQFKTSERSNQSGKWYGYDITNAPEPWVKEEEFAIYKSVHQGLAEKLVDGGIVANYEEKQEVQTSVDESM